MENFVICKKCEALLIVMNLLLMNVHCRNHRFEGDLSVNTTEDEKLYWLKFLIMNYGSIA